MRDLRCSYIISVISRIRSWKYSISEILVARPALEPRTPCSTSQEPIATPPLLTSRSVKIYQSIHSPRTLRTIWILSLWLVLMVIVSGFYASSNSPISFPPDLVVYCRRLPLIEVLASLYLPLERCSIVTNHSPLICQSQGERMHYFPSLSTTLKLVLTLHIEWLSQQNKIDMQHNGISDHVIYNALQYRKNNDKNIFEFDESFNFLLYKYLRRNSKNIDSRTVWLENGHSMISINIMPYLDCLSIYMSSLFTLSLCDMECIFEVPVGRNVMPQAE